MSTPIIEEVSGFMEDMSFQDEDCVYDWEEPEDSTDLMWEEEEEDE